MNRYFYKSIVVSDFKDQCFITRASECYFEAKNKSLGIGGKGHSFVVEGSVKGCYAYDSSSTEYKGMAFFGEKGPVKNMALKPIDQNSAYTSTYQIQKPCLKAGKTELFLIQVYNTQLLNDSNA